MTGALGATPADPCVNTSGALTEHTSNSIDTTHLNPTQIAIVKLLDSRLHINSLTQLSESTNLSVGCIHVANCSYVLGESLLEVSLNYHWFNAVTKRTDIRNVAFRKGIR